MISYEDQNIFLMQMAAVKTFRFIWEKGYPLPEKPISYFDDGYSVLEYCLKQIFSSVEYTDEKTRIDEHGNPFTVHEAICRFGKSYDVIPKEVKTIIKNIENNHSDYTGDIWFSTEPFMENGKFSGIVLIFYEDGYPDFFCDGYVADLVKILDILGLRKKGDINGSNNPAVG